MAFNRANQPSFNLFTGVGESPPLVQPLRQTFRTTMRASTATNAPHTVVPDNPVNEDLRAQLNTLRYELKTAKQEKAMLCQARPRLVITMPLPSSALTGGGACAIPAL